MRAAVESRCLTLVRGNILWKQDGTAGRKT